MIIDRVCRLGVAPRAVAIRCVAALFARTVEPPLYLHRDTLEISHLRRSCWCPTSAIFALYARWPIQSYQTPECHRVPRNIDTVICAVLSYVEHRIPSKTVRRATPECVQWRRRFCEALQQHLVRLQVLP